MLKRYKECLRAVVAELRHTLAGYADAAGAWQRGDLDRELERLGVATDASLTPLDALRDPTDAERRARYVAEAQLVGLPVAERARARAELVERAAYSWINRFLALRVMEARNLIDQTLRSNPDYGGVSEALYLLREQAPERVSGPDGGWWAVLENACQEQAATLPGLFDLGDPGVALRPSTTALLRCIAVVGGAPTGFTPNEADATFADPDAIGWAYQFYQEEAKARIDTKVKAGGKAESRAEIAAKTQLFSEPYMVQWLLQNSLGRSYHELYPDSKLPETWNYYVTLPTEDPKPAPAAMSLADLTVMDPCMGSGHFLREAFDMLVAMYREREGGLSASDVADRILSEHLHGIDIDPRCAQLAALTLYLRAWELVRDEAKARRRVGRAAYKPAAMNLATTPTGLTPGALKRHLTRHPQDRDFAPLLEGVFTALEHADVLGSLIQPGAQLDAAIAKLRQPHQMEMSFDADRDEFRRTIADLAKGDPAGLKQLLLDRVAASFATEVGSSDVAAELFGREFERGVRLVQSLDRNYAVVVTNPPYLGSGNMPSHLKRYTELQFPAGKRDLYTSFILKCLALAGDRGRVGMVTLHTFLTFTSSAELRKAMLKVAAIDQFVHLGTGTMKSLSNPNAQGFCMYVLRRAAESAIPDLNGVFIRLIDLHDKEEGVRAVSAEPSAFRKRLFVRRMREFLTLPDCQIIYSLGDRLIEKLAGPSTLGSIAAVPKGLTTSDNDRFLRYTWEATGLCSWVPYAKGGGYRKWFGLQLYCVRWGLDGAYIKAHPSSVIRNERFYTRNGLTYTEVANGSLGVRLLDGAELFDSKSPSIFPYDTDRYPLLGLLNSRIGTFFFRCLSPALLMDQAYAPRLPVPEQPPSKEVGLLAATASDLKQRLTSFDVIERSFDQASIGRDQHRVRPFLETMLHVVEGRLESAAFGAYAIDAEDRLQLIGETGVPVGWHRLVAGYEALPEWPGENTAYYPDTGTLLVADLAGIQSQVLSTEELLQLRDRFRKVYEAGPGANASTEDDENAPDEASTGALGAYIPIPAETFVEQLSQTLEIHPISVYWLLEELRGEGVRCKPEEQRLLEDRLSVHVVRLLGHRWPKQIEAGEPVPDWADRDGIIPLSPVTGVPTVADRLRERLRAEDGDLGAQRIDALLQELTGLTLEEWMRRQFFARHVQQFKHRPIAWHLASAPFSDGKRRGGSRRQPAFECLVYYHACAGDVLARVRTRYVQPLVLVERRRAEEARRNGDDSAAGLAAESVAELEDFAARLRQVDETGFAGADLDRLLATESLDRWSGDGNSAPTSRDELLRAERTWRVDLNDGVRVNIAPLQLAGVLASDVLKAADAQEAIADRARWRSDERRWVREGKLPRCGWMDDRIPESLRWQDLAPQRDVERRKLEEKRQSAAKSLP